MFLLLLCLGIKLRYNYLTLHILFIIINVCSLGIDSITFVLLTQCPTNWQEYCIIFYILYNSLYYILIHVICYMFLLICGQRSYRKNKDKPGHGHDGKLIPVHPWRKSVLYFGGLFSLLPCTQSLLERSDDEDESLWS